MSSYTWLTNPLHSPKPEQLTEFSAYPSPPQSRPAKQRAVAGLPPRPPKINKHPVARAGSRDTAGRDEPPTHGSPTQARRNIPAAADSSDTPATKTDRSWHSSRPLARETTSNVASSIVMMISIPAPFVACVMRSPRRTGLGQEACQAGSSRAKRQCRELKVHTGRVGTESPNSTASIATLIQKHTLTCELYICKRSLGYRDAIRMQWATLFTLVLP